MGDNIEVSIICMAYNQENYIINALNSMLAQKTDFKYEIIVHDDKSTDGTTNIIKEFEKKYPNKIKALYEDVNQYSQGVDIFVKICMPEASGKYIAICEGDDYWTSDNKLQKQYSLLENHPEVDMCCCGALVITNGCVTQAIRPHQMNGILTTEEVILGGGLFIATATLFFRKTIFSEFMKFQEILSFDYSYQIRGALRGGIYYLDEIMAVYRSGVENSWTTRMKQDKRKSEEFHNLEISMLRQLDNDTFGKYHDAITQRIMAYNPFAELMQHRDEILDKLSSHGRSRIYLWGLGMRGEATQEFCRKESIVLCGVCDIKINDIGAKTVYGFKIVSLNEAFENSDIILASNNAVDKYLRRKKYSGKIINIQQYIPLV